MIVEELVAGEVGTCSADTPIVEAAKQMIADDVGSLLVMDDTDIVGIVTERDVLRAVAEGKTQGIVKAIMTPEPDLLESDVAVTEAAEWMMAAGYRHLPVVKQGQLIGMVSIKDLVWALTEQIRGREEE
ncbi:MAG: CBS domain-containing protein [Actinomycetes bacterium]|nr:CBS domain-containing protein [Acidimicrobiia bacterium]